MSLEDFCSLRKRTIPSHRRSPPGNGSRVVLFIMWVQLVWLSFACPPHRGKEFIINHLRMQDVSCYWEKLLTEYSRLLTYKPKRRKNYSEVVHRPTKTELWGMLKRMRAAVLNRLSWKSVISDISGIFRGLFFCNLFPTMNTQSRGAGHEGRESSVLVCIS